MKQELLDIMGVDAIGEEEITKAMKMLGVTTGMESAVQEDAGTSAMDHIISHLDHAKFILDKGSFRDSDELEFQDHYNEIDALINAKAPNSDILAKMRQHVPGVDDSKDEIRADLIKMIEI